MADESLTFIIEAKDLASRALGKVSAEVNGLDPALTKATTKGVLFGNLLTRGAELVGEGLRNVVDFVGDSIGAASDLAESQSKANVVFGESVDVVDEFGATSAEAAGISKQATLEAAGAFGNMFNTIGLAQDASADMSVTMVQLASDMGSFNNQDPTDMLLRLRSGLAGEAEPLRKFGVLLSEARVKEEAYASGIAQTGDELTEQQKVQARYQLILKDTAVQQGDFARTSEEAAGSQRQLQAEIADVQAEVGQELLPVYKDVLHFLKDDLVPWIRSSLIPWLRQTADDIGTMVHDIVHAFEVAGQALDSLALDWGDEGQRIHDIADNLGSDFEGVGDKFNLVKERVRMYMETFGLSFEEAAGRAEASFVHLPDVAGDAVLDTAKAYRLALPEVTGAWNDVAAVGPKALRDAKGKAHQITMGALSQLVDDLVSGQTDWQDAWDDYGDIMENDLTKQEELVQIHNKLRSKEIRRGLNSDDKEQRAATREIVRILKARERELRGHVDRVKNILTFDEGQAGVDVAQSWIDGLTRTLRGSIVPVQKAAAILLEQTLGRNPPPSSGPLSAPLMRRAGSDVVAEWIGGAASAIGDAVAPLRSAASGMLGTDALAPTVAPAMAGAGMAGAYPAGSVTINFNSTIPPTPAQGQELARRIGPELKRWMRNN